MSKDNIVLTVWKGAAGGPRGSETEPKWFKSDDWAIDPDTIMEAPALAVALRRSAHPPQRYIVLRIM